MLPVCRKDEDKEKEAVNGPLKKPFLKLMGGHLFTTFSIGTVDSE